MPVSWSSLQSLFQFGAAANLGISGVFIVFGSRFEREKLLIDNYDQNIKFFKQEVSHNEICDPIIDNRLKQIERLRIKFDLDYRKQEGKIAALRRRGVIAVFCLSFISLVLLFISSWPIERGLPTDYSAVFIAAIVLSGPPYLLIFLFPRLESLVSNSFRKIRVEISDLHRSMLDRYDELRPRTKNGLEGDHGI